MSKGHTAVNEFLKKKERYADFFNGNFFQGQRVVLPEDLEIIKGESDILVEDKEKKPKDVHRYRDIVMLWKKEIYLVVLACENQSKVHYAMPVRRMLYDSLSYVEQMKDIWQRYERIPEVSEKKVTRNEYLSRFRKGDRIVPVITAVFYYGTEEWDASTDLYGMFANAAFLENELVQKYIPNYWINLIQADSVEDINCFRTDLKEIFGMMKCRKDKKALQTYLQENADYFKHVDFETYYAIGEILQSETILKKEIAKEEAEGDMDMCKALEDWYQDGVNEGKELGKELGKEQVLREQVKKKLEKGFSAPEIAEMLEVEQEVIEEMILSLSKDNG